VAASESALFVPAREKERRGFPISATMDDHRESSPFVRMQPGRSMIRPQAAARKFFAPSPPERAARQLANRLAGEPEAMSSSPQSTASKRSSHAPLEALKQWELVEDDRGLQVVEKRAAGGSLVGPVRPTKELSLPMSSPIYGRTPVSGRKLLGQAPGSASPEEKLVRGYDESRLVQPMRLPLVQSREQTPDKPLSLDLILKQQQQQQQQQQQRSTTIESTDMLQRLEQQVKAIEMGTIAARTTRQLENSADFGPEVQLRYREHEDLLRNVTDDEAEG